MDNTLIDDGEPADKWHPGSDFWSDWLLLTQRARALASELINGKDRFAELREVDKAVARVARLWRQWMRDQISFDEMVATARRERLRLVPNEPAPASPAA
jgi:hypothetical protein